LHVTRPILNILSLVIDECDLSSIDVRNSGNKFNSLFGKSSVKQLYEAFAVGADAVQNTGVAVSDDDDDNDGGGGEKKADSDSDSLPPTPPPVGILINASEEREVERIYEVRQSPSKKRKLKF
uniref:Condensin complex subunit 2 n=1 Tax=Gongylonema pulchrum TaxID=637853 RepID=A0A183EJJ6_9BILA